MPDQATEIIVHRMRHPRILRVRKKGQHAFSDSKESTNEGSKCSTESSQSAPSPCPPKGTTHESQSQHVARNKRCKSLDHGRVHSRKLKVAWKRDGSAGGARSEVTRSGPKRAQIWRRRTAMESWQKRKKRGIWSGGSGQQELGGPGAARLTSTAFNTHWKRTGQRHGMSRDQVSAPYLPSPSAGRRKGNHNRQLSSSARPLSLRPPRSRHPSTSSPPPQCIPSR